MRIARIDWEEVIRLYYANYSLDDIATIMECSRTQIRTILQKRGVLEKPKKKKSHERKEIDTRELGRLKDASVSIINKLNNYNLPQTVYNDIELLARLTFLYGMEKKSIEIERNKKML